jgi:hypothetical protein
LDKNLLLKPCNESPGSRSYFMNGGDNDWANNVDTSGNRLSRSA